MRRTNCCTVGATTTSTATTAATTTTTKAGTTTTTAPLPVGPAGYSFCVKENGTCTFSGSASVAYGANGAFKYLNATNSIACNNATFGDPIAGAAKSCFYKLADVALGNIVPLFNSANALEPVIQFDRGDALVTRFSDRARDRHAKENHFQLHDHYLPFYWETRTDQIEI